MNVLITGAGRGLGRVLAFAFGREGHRVMVNYRHSKKEAEETVEKLKAEGREADLIKADVSSPEEALSAVKRVVEKWGSIDVLVNNAGVTKDRTILKMTPSEWREVVDVNLNGSFWCLKAAAHYMSRKKNGQILNIASMLAVRGGSGAANYAASKAGLIALTKSAARELGRYNVSVNALLPGFHATAMNAGFSRDILEKIREEHVLGRFPDAEEMARFAVFICRQTSVSGQVFYFESRVV